MAQSVEQLICNLQVMGSSPFTSSRKKQKALTEISVRAFLLFITWMRGCVGKKAQLCGKIERCCLGETVFENLEKKLSLVENYSSKHCWCVIVKPSL